MDPMTSAIAAPLLGGGLIGLAAALLLVAHGRIAGISGIISGLLTAAPGDRSWRGAFVLGLLAGGAVLLALAPERIVETPQPLALTLVGGLFVGFGTRLGSGCTSGHGVCGLGRLSPRSFVATLTFIAAGALAVAGTRAFLGGV